MRRGLRSAGVTSSRVIGITEPRANSRSLFLTPNTETTYGTTFLDLREWGPTVIEAPPESLCVVDDFWFRYVADMGIAGPDRGAGGAYLFVPPGYEGDLPDEGFFVYHCPTFTNWVVWGGRRAGDEADPHLPPRRGRWPLRRTSSSTWPTQVFNTVHSNDFSFFEEVAEIIEEEPTDALDAERAGQLAAIGLVAGQPFTPTSGCAGSCRRRRDDRSRAWPVTVAYAPRDPDAVLVGSWKNAFVGGSHEFLRNGARLLDARTQFHGPAEASLTY